MWRMRILGGGRALVPFAIIAENCSSMHRVLVWPRLPGAASIGSRRHPACSRFWPTLFGHLVLRVALDVEITADTLRYDTATDCCLAAVAGRLLPPRPASVAMADGEHGEHGEHGADVVEAVVRPALACFCSLLFPATFHMPSAAWSRDCTAALDRHAAALQSTVALTSRLAAMHKMPGEIMSNLAVLAAALTKVLATAAERSG